MPKMKTNKSAAKRIRQITRRGKVLRKKMSAQHRTYGKSKRTLRNASKSAVVSSANLKRLKRLVPYL